MTKEKIRYYAKLCREFFLFHNDTQNIVVLAWDGETKYGSRWDNPKNKEELSLLDANSRKVAYNFDEVVESLKFENKPMFTLNIANLDKGVSPTNFWYTTQRADNPFVGDALKALVTCIIVPDAELEWYQE